MAYAEINHFDWLLMMIAARSPGLISASSRARASGIVISLKSEYVRRVFSLSRSDSIRQVSFGQRSSASRSAAPRQLYWSRLSIKDLFHHRGTAARRKAYLSVHYPFQRMPYDSEQRTMKLITGSP